MSGIAGFFSNGNRAIRSDIWERMVILARERGRDTQLTWSHPAHPADYTNHRAALAQTWAKMADGRTPPRAIASDDGSIVVALDGVIYNTEELRELERVAPGRRLSAGQLIGLAYEEWGFDCVSKLNGDFAFAVYDRRRDLLFCARDRTGTRPFYFARLDDALIFGSEIKIVLAHPEVRRDPDWESIYNYSGSHYRLFDSRPGRTCFRAVQQLPQATCLVATAEGVRTWRYWSLNTEAEWEGNETSAAARLLELLDESVQLRIESSHNCGFTLSSGLDSTSVLSLGSRYLDLPAEVYSTRYNVKTAYDETLQVQPAAQEMGINWRVVGVGGAALEASLSAMLRRHDEPVSEATWLSHYQVSKAAAQQGIKVLFGGLGADELLAGQPDHFLYFFADLQQAGMGEKLNHEIDCWTKLYSSSNGTASKHTGALSREMVEDVFNRLVDWDPPGTVKLDMERYVAYQSALMPDFVAQFGTPPPVDNPFSSYLKNRCYQDLFFETIPACLRADDRNVSSFGMRSCYPFLDYRVIELCFGFPLLLNYKDGITKPLLRTAMKGIIPETTRKRTAKISWNAPSTEWFRTEWVNFANDLIGSAAFRQRGVYDQKRVQAIFEEHRRGEANHAKFLWQMINVELWFRQWAG
jgi:asparagine synthase (glutamine-hydrolysing)